MRRVGAIALALAAGTVAGCASNFAACPAAGGPVWRELASDHFVLRTDLGLDEARDTLRDLENLRAALLTCLRAPPGIDTGHVPVIVVRDGWDQVCSPDVAGFFT